MVLNYIFMADVLVITIHEDILFVKSTICGLIKEKKKNLLTL